MIDGASASAGVIGHEIAHEIGHVTARHGAQRATRQQNAGLGVLAATVLGAVLGAGDLATNEQRLNDSRAIAETLGPQAGSSWGDDNRALNAASGRLRSRLAR